MQKTRSQHDEVAKVGIALDSQRLLIDLIHQGYLTRLLSLQALLIVLRLGQVGFCQAQIVFWGRQFILGPRDSAQQGGEMQFRVIEMPIVAQRQAAGLAA